MNFGLNLWNKVFGRMFGFIMMLIMTLSGHPWIINKMAIIWPFATIISKLQLLINCFKNSSLYKKSTQTNSPKNAHKSNPKIVQIVEVQKVNEVNKFWLKPLQNKKGQKNLRYPKESSPFLNKKTALLLGTSNFFDPSYSETALESKWGSFWGH